MNTPAHHSGSAIVSEPDHEIPDKGRQPVADIRCTAPQALKKAAFFGRSDLIERVYGKGRREQVATLADIYPHLVTLANFEEHAEHLRDVEAIFSTWGMPQLTPAHLDRLPALRAVFFAAGTVKSFAAPFLARNITVVSAWQANALPPAEFTLAQILLATKGYFSNKLEFCSPGGWETAFRGLGNFGESVAILGAGAVGQNVIKLLRPFHLRVIVFDPFLSEENAVELGVEKVTLEQAFERAYVVSNHLANLPATEHILHGGLFVKMRKHATFINTGRGLTVDEEAMIRVLQARPDITALLDVTWPEPPACGSPLYTLPNVHLTTHIAGSLGDEVVRMADYCIEEFVAWCQGRPLRYGVSRQMLETMA